MNKKELENLVKGGAETFCDSVVVAVAAISGLLILVIILAFK